LDHVGNTQRLGHHLEDREWTLDGTPKKDREAAPSVKVCPKCFACLPSGKPRCDECGHEFLPERRELQHVDGELVEVQRVAYRVGDAVEWMRGSRWDPGWIVRELVNEMVLIAPISDPRAQGTQWVQSAKLLRPLDRKREQAQANTIDELIAIGRRRGMKSPHGWARHVMAARQNRSHAGVRR
jgi:hypothetical protein